MSSTNLVEGIVFVSGAPEESFAALQQLDLRGQWCAERVVAAK